jgi:Skp family chaperone for outer membrane proteins
VAPAGEAAPARTPATSEAASTAGDPSADAGKTDRVISAIREDFKAERTKRQEAEKRLTDMQAALDADKAERAKRDKALAVALGLASDEEPPDPAKLAADLKAAQDQASADLAQRDNALRTQQVENAILRNAAKHGGNGDALLDSRSFMNAVHGLDPGAADFAEKLGDAIRNAVDSGAQFKAPAAEPAAPKQPTVARSGGEFNSAPGGNRQWTVEDVDRASASEVTAAQEAGLLMNLGFAPKKQRR